MAVGGVGLASGSRSNPPSFSFGPCNPELFFWSLQSQAFLSNPNFSFGPSKLCESLSKTPRYITKQLANEPDVIAVHALLPGFASPRLTTYLRPASLQSLQSIPRFRICRHSGQWDAWCLTPGISPRIRRSLGSSGRVVNNREPDLDPPELPPFPRTAA